ncbi:MAG: ABC transporter substrate-binding protein/permease [Erysipelotrichaceae bacterium]|nr:ABC transporter substrate-binding protein/permease [Erysipelotrichaceae bacterium]
MKKLIVCLLVLINLLTVNVFSDEEVTVSSFNNSDIKVGVQTGSIQEGIIDKNLPNAQKVYFDDYSAISLALSEGKIDCFVVPRMMYLRIKETYNQFKMCSETFEGGDVAFGVSKDPSKDKIYEQLCEYITNNKALLDDLFEQWTTNIDEVERPNYKDLSAENGVLQIVTAATAQPLVYVENNEITGFEIDVLTRFGKEYGYGLELTNTSFDSVILSLKQDKADIASAFLAATEERKESIRFSTPYYNEYNLLVYCDEISIGTSNGFFDNFNKSFIKEDRYKLLLDGFVTTILIAVSSTVLATLLAGVICYLKIKGNKVVASICNGYIQIFEGTPILVLLLVFYYIIFSDRGTSAILVSIIVCSLNSAAFFAESFYAGITNVDPGQKEAGLSLGYSEFQTFIKFVLPSAAQTFLPTYQSSIISLLKGTSVVSYISVQDLTKAAEIIRSRTYEPMLPLITIALVYFLLSRLITYIFKRIQESMKPQRCGKYLKGVKLHDQD